MASNAASPTSPSAESPRTDSNPIFSRKPSLCMKPAQTPPAASPPSSSNSAQLSLTSKQWVIPPRPKPGRKPATDTPPTKRKAQNRAAQRAFRERRAARVGELEEQLKQIEEENEQEQETLKFKVDKLEQEVEQYQKELARWVDRCRRLETELATFKNASTSNSKPVSPNQNEPDVTGNDTSIGCGNCTIETRCQCIDDAFAVMDGNGAAATPNHQYEKRPHSPSQVALGEKRIKLELKESMEIDFTAAYASKPPPAARVENHSPTSAVADPCGFCSDGTPCICAEVAAEQEQQSQTNNNTISMISRATPRQLDQFTPPPSEGDVSYPMPASNSGVSSGCGASGPGTCAQCRADPNSTLFCKSLAASRAQSSSTPSACCGGQTPGGSCCQSNASATTALPLQGRANLRTTRSRTAASQSLPQPDVVAMRRPSSGVTLTCADAYTTLSRHPAYERAAGDIGEWMPKLHASEPLGARSVEGRPALEIDAANVMAVLRDFDRRFGKSP